MQRSSVITIFVIFLIVVGAGVYTYFVSMTGEEVDSEADRVLQGDAESGNVFTDLENGNEINLSQYDGQVRVVNSWASWCPFCVNELPDFNTLGNEFNSQGVVVLAINRAETRMQAQRFVNEFGPFDDIVFVQDASDSFYNSIGGFTMPETIFYDREGNVSFHKRGFMSLEEMRTHTKDALAATNTE